MCTSFYLGALQAAVFMGQELNDEVPLYAELLQRGLPKAETDLFNGEYFYQRVEWKNLRAKNPLENKSMVGSYSPEAVALFEKEGPGQSGESPSRGSQIQFQERSLGLRKSAAAQLRLRLRARLDPLHVAQRWSVKSSVPVFQRSLDWF